MKAGEQVDYLELRELRHHGIKGQHWGDRKYQYEDGSLTPEGKERYGIKGTREYRKILKGDVKAYRQAVKDYNKESKHLSRKARKQGREELEENFKKKYGEERYNEIRDKSKTETAKKVIGATLAIAGAITVAKIAATVYNDKKVYGAMNKEAFEEAAKRKQTVEDLLSKSGSRPDPAYVTRLAYEGDINRIMNIDTVDTFSNSGRAKQAAEANAVSNGYAKRMLETLTDKAAKEASEAYKPKLEVPKTSSSSSSYTPKLNLFSGGSSSGSGGSRVTSSISRAASSSSSKPISGINSSSVSSGASSFKDLINQNSDILNSMYDELLKGIK